MAGPESRIQKTPNIIFITTDYQRGVDVPGFGCDFLDMPNLNWLCKEGAVFRRHFSTSPICMPARFTWATGQYPHTHGMWDNGERPWPKGTPTLMQCLKDVGYNTIGVGKMHFYPWDRQVGFDRWISADCKWGRGPDAVDDYEKFLNRHKLSRADYKKFGDMTAHDWPFDESLHIDAFVGDQAAGIIERDELTGPFFMWVSFNGPHNPWDPPAEYSAKYKKMDLPLADTSEKELLTKPYDHTRHRYCYGPGLWDRIDSQPEKRDEILGAIRAGHYGNLSFIDKQLGKLLTALEKKSLLDNTAIFYSSDHGCALGNHNMMHKGTHYDTDARVPFVVRYPAMVKPGLIDAFCSQVDVLPTFISLAGGNIPAGAEGKDITPLLTGDAEAIDDFVVIECTLVTSIVTDHWKMGIHHFNNEGDLYDLKTDPKELKNLFDNPAYAKLRAEWTEKLVKWRKSLSPDMNIHDDPFQWRDCLGPEVDLWRDSYKQQYSNLSKMVGRPGKTGPEYYNHVMLGNYPTQE